MRALLLLLLPFLPAIASAQGAKADYERSQSVFQRFSGKVTRDRVEPTWAADGKKLWYPDPAAKGKYVLVDIEKATKEVVAEADLPKGGIRPTPPKKKGRGDEPENPFAEHEASEYWEVEEFQRQPGSGFGTSPDGKWTASIKDNNVVLRPAGGGDEVQLSTDGKADNSYGRLFWSPDSTTMIAMQTKPAEDRKVTLVESSPRDQLQPKTSTYDYLKPGDRIAQTKPRLFDIATKKQVAVSDELFANPWSVSDERWSKDGKRFLFCYNQRGHGVMRVLAIDAATGKVEKVINEECKTFFDYSYKKYLRYVADGDELLWMSERDGWNHLYRIDAKTGEVKNQITKGEWVVNRVLEMNAEAKELTLEVAGIYPKQDPYHAHYVRVKFDGTGLTHLTDGDGTHASPTFSPDKKHYIVTCSRVDLAPVTELRRTADGKKVLELERADITALEKAGWKPPERFVAKGRDGKTDIHGILHRPTNFDPKKKYPVIEAIYAGPQGFFVPKAFRSVHNAQSLAELGFILVQIDGMGTNGRSKAFHDVCWKNLGDSGFPDRILWIKAAAAKYPEMDLSKGVGIYGGSAGGQSSTRAVFAHPDFYTVAVSDCGCHDNRVDKIWWNELWMSYPIGKHYAEQSNANPEIVRQFTGKLMLTVGELDKNVDPSSTMQVVNQLIRANKDFELIVFPGGGHGAGGSPYGVRRRADFFVRHLMGVEPRAK